MSMIYGKRVRLRAVEREDIKQFVLWVNDPEVTRYLSLYLPMSTVDEENWFEAMSKRDQNSKPLVIEIPNNGGWKMIGNCAVFGIDPIARLGELGIMLGEKDEWNQGYGTETMTLLLLHCFNTLNLNRVFLQVYAQNERAKQAYKKAGFIEEGRLREAVYKHGNYDDLIVMSALRSEWTLKIKEK